MEYFEKFCLHYIILIKYAISEHVKGRQAEHIFDWCLELIIYKSINNKSQLGVDGILVAMYEFLLLFLYFLCTRISHVLLFFL